MRRITELEAHLVASVGLPAENVQAHVSGAKLTPFARDTATGTFFQTREYTATLYVFDLDATKFDDLCLILADWFRDDPEDGDVYEIDLDPIDDQLSLATITATLSESRHLIPDAAGPYQRDGQRWSLADAPELNGI